MQRYQLTLAQIYDTLTSSPDGLTTDQAQEVIQRIGPNHIETMSGTSILTKFFGQFKDWMIILLIVSAGLSFYLGEMRSGIVLSAIVLFNALIGFVQEYRAEKVMESLKSLVHPSAKVLRNGIIIELPVQQIVPGDVIVLEEGDSVPADVRIIQDDDIATNDFALTGESNPVKKTTDPIAREVALGERANLAFMGTTVARGRGRGIVVATGKDTVLGQIASLSDATTTDISPLQEEINNISLKLTIGTVVIGIVLFVVALLIDLSLYDSFLFALGIAMSLVPQGMPAQISIALSLASSRLSHQNVVVKKLSSVETLGSTTIICTDKTGTLTQNQMTVEHVILGTDIYNVSGSGYEPNGNIIDGDGLSLDHTMLKRWRYFFWTGVLASTARLQQPDDNHTQRHILGDPTEGALITLAAKAGFDQKTLEENYPMIKLFPFDSERKRMSCVRQVGGHNVLFVKGAPDTMLSRCTMMVDDDMERKITPADTELLLEQNIRWASRARRQLVFAYKVLSPDIDINHSVDDLIESDLTYLGMVSMIDPPRPEVAAAMKAARDAHINVAVITGDHALTATAIARQVGIDADGGEILSITGSEIERMTDEDIVIACRDNHVIFSRTAPHDKLRIVSALKDADEIVAVTGDGINDAPALKKSDIGVAMGISGTDVSKDASDLILLEDNFSDLVTAIREGRIIFANLTKTILSSMTSNLGELTLVLLSLVGAGIRGWPIAIIPILILLTDLIGEMAPLTALTRDPAKESLMTQPPRRTDQHLLRRETIVDLVWSGFLMGLLPYLAFVVHTYLTGESLTTLEGVNYGTAVTVTYAAILFCQYANILSRRAGTDSIFTPYFWSNPRLLRSIVGTLIVVSCLMYIPALSQTVGTGPLSIVDRGLALGAGLIFLVIREIYKNINN